MTLRFLARLAVLLAALAGPAMPAAAATLPEADPESLGLSPQRLAVLDSAIESEIASGNATGVVVGVLRHGKVAHFKAYGHANRERGEAMSRDHLFRLYSMTKPVASVALLTLYEQGLFQLTDPLDMYIPAFRDLKVFAGYDEAGNMILEEPARRPTIQDAFRHTLGLASGVGQGEVNALYQEAGLTFGRLESLSEEIDKLSGMPLLYHPGERWVYGLGHDVQAWLVEHFSGMPYDQYLEQVIFEPLGMEDTVFGVPDSLASRFATVYRPAGEGLEAEAVDGYARYTTRPFATLSLSSTTGDYLAFAGMLLNGGELNGTRILGRKTVELMSRNHLPENIPSISASGPAANGYGLGVSVTLDTAALGRLGSVGSFGWGGAATTTFRVDPREDMAYVIMAQRFPNDTALLNKVEVLIYQALVAE